MRYYQRTGKNSGFSVGPLGMIIMLAAVCYVLAKIF